MEDIKGYKEPRSITRSQDVPNYSAFFDICNSFSYMTLEFSIEENQPPLKVLVMDYLPHLRRSTYLQEDLQFIKPHQNCYSFACRSIGSHEAMPGAVWIDRVRCLILFKLGVETQDQRVREIFEAGTITNNSQKLKEVSKLIGDDRMLEIGAQELSTLNLPKTLLKEYLTGSFQAADKLVCSKLDLLLKADGLIPLSAYSEHPPGHLIIAFRQETDYHFLRLEGDGWWECVVNMGIKRKAEGTRIPHPNEVYTHFGLDSKQYFFEGYYIVPSKLAVKDFNGKCLNKEGFNFHFSKGQIEGITRGDHAFHEELFLRWNA